MFIFITISSIVAIALIAAILNKVLSFFICPICAGVCGTWLWMLSAFYFGYNIDPVILATLMGGSVVGISYKVDSYLTDKHSSVIFKAIFIPLGFLTVFGLLKYIFVMSAITFILQFLTVMFFLNTRHSNNSSTKTTDELKKKMDKCC